uniref:Putative LAGLIDADG homing endonuclease n=1 Tax=Monomastix sp. (strain OKE-1) TaxID=141716 RepID=U5YEP9_MONSK|nr:putative LAGLIDADG homing endonuclease [Monomastix sp. OKE-1]AGZ90187.1 putative LAGLIDADG homing endonuclease [Monomastix sp. OKE-1]
MCITKKQSAWADGSTIFRKGEQWFTSSSHQRLNVKHPFTHHINLSHWLVGFTDGDGCFSMNETKDGVWQFTFQISASLYNLRVLYFIKSVLQVGSVSYAGERMAQYRVRDRRYLKNSILPIFDGSSLFSVKAYDYEAFKQGLFIYEDPTLSYAEKSERLRALRAAALENKKKASPAWGRGERPTKSWVLGFTEAEGSFYITKKEKERYCHGFGLTQKTDEIILLFFREIFQIRAQVKWNSAGSTFWSLDTTNFRSIQNIEAFFKNTFKGVKSLEFRIWSRALKYRGQCETLKHTQDFLRRLRKSPFIGDEDRRSGGRSLCERPQDRRSAPMSVAHGGLECSSAPHEHCSWGRE